jgi:hypothetical protein
MIHDNALWQEDNSPSQGNRKEAKLTLQQQSFLFKTPQSTS